MFYNAGVAISGRLWSLLVSGLFHISLPGAVPLGAAIQAGLPLLPVQVWEGALPLVLILSRCNGSYLVRQLGLRHLLSIGQFYPLVNQDLRQSCYTSAEDAIKCLIIKPADHT